MLQGAVFTWDSEKEDANIRKHTVSLKEACEVFFDSLYEMEDASVEGEQRWAFIGYSKANRSLYVVAAEQGEDSWRIISARKLTAEERLRYEEEDDTY
ncbi:MAG: BrnT family toxin [Desulfomonilaceae bacterium]